MPTTTFTPTWTDNVSVLAPTTVAALGLARGTIDLRSKAGAYLFGWIGRKATTVLAAAIQVEVRRVLNNGAATTGGTGGAGGASFASSVAVTNVTTVNVDGTAGGTTIGVASATGIVAGDLLCVYDASFTRLEFARVSKVVSTTVTVDAPLQFAHTSAQGDAVTRLADRFGPAYLAGGSLYEVVFDYGGSATGGDVVVLAKAQTYDSDQGVTP